MSDGLSDLKRVLSASGIYAAAALAQRGLAFLLLPIYTRYIDPSEYGKLELLTTFTTLVFGLLAMGLPSAIQKCFHRDAKTPEEQGRVLPTALALSVPVILGGGLVLMASAPTVARILIGDAQDTDLVRLALATGVTFSIAGLILANLRARERATAFSLVSLSQFVIALVLNILLVVKFGMGVRGVLWGNLISTALMLPLAMIVGRQDLGLRFSRPLMAPLLRFGLLLIPVVFSGWIINMSDRYVLRLFRDLADVAVYGVGYKFGMIIELVVVWPFQLAWPAFSFSISHREDHRQTYSRALTYLSAVLAYLIVGLSLLTRVLTQAIVGEAYRMAYTVVPLVALAYAFNGIQFCVSPGVHISEKTRYLTYISMTAAVLNLGLNFLLIPRWGMMGAAWATVLAFLLVAVVTTLVSKHFYAVEYETGRLIKIGLLGLAAWWLGTLVPPELSAFSIVWHIAVAVLAFPLGLLALGFFDQEEKRFAREQLGRLAALRGR